MSNDITHDNLFAVLLENVPEYRNQFDDDLACYGEVIPHVFFGTFTRFVLGAVVNKQHQIVSRALSFIERALASKDEDVVNVAAASFVENLFGEAGCSELLANAGPKLCKEYKRPWGSLR